MISTLGFELVRYVFTDGDLSDVEHYILMLLSRCNDPESIHMQMEQKFKAFLKALTHNSCNLEDLQLSMPMSKPVLHSLTEGLSLGLQSLKRLSFRGSFLGDQGVQQLCTVMQRCRGIQELDVSGCHVSDLGAFSIASLVKDRALSCALVYSRNEQVYTS
jgi:hypothetical protein